MTRNKNLMTHSSVADIPRLAEWYHPNLNKYSADSISSKSVVICWWTCDKGHTFQRTPNTVSKNTNPCTECNPYRRVVAGVNDLSTTHPEVAINFSKKNSLPVTSYSKGHKEKVIWECRKGHEYVQAVYIEIRPNHGCPICSGQRFVPGINDIETLRPDLKAMWSSENEPMKNFSINSPYEANWVCEFEHKFRARVRSMVKRIDLCHDCPKSIPFDESVASSKILNKIWSSKNPIPSKFYKPNSHQKVIWEFETCGHEAYMDVKHMNKRDGMCPICSYGGSSSQEEFLANLVIDRYGVEIDRRVRILDGREIDIYIEKLNKGIEFNGELWHRDAKAVKAGFDSAEDMHLQKLTKAAELNIDLVFVWAHDWRKHRDEVLQALDKWILQKTEPDAILKRLVSLNDGAICCVC